MIAIATVLAAVACLTIAAPAVKYDQRQEGDVNIRADLENFVILIIPTSGTANMGLLDILSKSIPGKGLLKHNKHSSKPQPQETQHFIESKTAPYHVDISRTRAHLAKLRPHTQHQVSQQANDEVLIAHSPTVALNKHNVVGEPEDREDRTANQLITISNYKCNFYKCLELSSEEYSCLRDEISQDETTGVVFM